MKPRSLTIADVTYDQLASTIDHSLLRPELTLAEVERGCELADRYRVASVCARPSDVVDCVRLLSDSSVAVGTVIGFPHGSTDTATKRFESETAISNGADELDMVINIGRLLSGDHETVELDVRAVVEAAAGAALVKVILENAYLTDDLKTRGARIAEAAGADYVKTSTGFAPTGATIADIELMRSSVGPDVRIKAAHGIRTLDALLAVIEAGCDRVGATATATILDDYRARSSA